MLVRSKIRNACEIKNFSSICRKNGKTQAKFVKTTKQNKFKFEMLKIRKKYQNTKFSVSRMVENPRKRETLTLAVSRTFCQSFNGLLLFF